MRSSHLFVHLAAYIAGCVAAPPRSNGFNIGTHRIRDIGGQSVSMYHPEGVYKTFGIGVEAPAKKRGVSSAEDNALSFLMQELGVSGDALEIRTSANTDMGERIWAHQMINGIAVYNAVANVGLNLNQDVVAFGANFDGSKAFQVTASPDPSISKADAIAAAESQLGGKYNGEEVLVRYYQTEDNGLVLTYVVQVETEASWFQALIDASSGVLVASHDFVSDATYKAVPDDVQDLTEAYKLIQEPASLSPSPSGWHNASNITTIGNNVVSYKGNIANVTLASAANGLFNYTYDLTADPNSGFNVDAAKVNTFVLVNIIHDVTYLYGFTEKTFNFQNDNFDKGGKGGDRIIISVQDSGGFNNANFATPSDGSSGRMRMYIWTKTELRRDGALSNDIVTHEATHGVTNRMTGGGTGNCLGTSESAGMGEGWSDAMADWFERTSAQDRDFRLARWVTNSTGLRKYPYSTNNKTNPQLYSDIPVTTEVHAIGQIWGNMLHNVYELLVAEHGWSATAKTMPDGEEGNIVFLHLFMDALLLQPCNPSFLSARDAIIQADQNRYGGIHRCTVWKAFASRGMGASADRRFTNNFDLPLECGGPTPTYTYIPPTTTTTKDTRITLQPTWTVTRAPLPTTSTITRSPIN